MLLPDATTVLVADRVATLRAAPHVGASGAAAARLRGAVGRALVRTGARLLGEPQPLPAGTRQ